MKVAADWASDSASDWAADWASDSTHFNSLKVDFRKDYFQLFFRVLCMTCIDNIIYTLFAFHFISSNTFQDIST